MLITRESNNVWEKRDNARIFLLSPQRTLYIPVRAKKCLPIVYKSVLNASHLHSVSSIFVSMGELVKHYSTQVSHDTHWNYWEGRWQKNLIGFHRHGVNEYV